MEQLFKAVPSSGPGRQSNAWVNLSRFKMNFHMIITIMTSEYRECSSWSSFQGQTVKARSRGMGEKTRRRDAWPVLFLFLTHSL